MFLFFHNFGEVPTAMPALQDLVDNNEIRISRSPTVGKVGEVTVFTAVIPPGLDDIEWIVGGARGHRGATLRWDWTRHGEIPVSLLVTLGSGQVSIETTVAVQRGDPDFPGSLYVGPASNSDTIATDLDTGEPVEPASDAGAPSGNVGPAPEDPIVAEPPWIDEIPEELP
jgi:hypothetical protein